MKTNQLKAGVVLSYISIGANIIIQLVYTPIMIKILGQSEYGLYTLVGSVVSYLGLFSLGFTGAYMRFYARASKSENEDEEARLNGLFLSVFLVMGCAAILCGMILSQNTASLFGSRLTSTEIQKAKILMEILVLNIGLTFPSAVFNSILSAHEEFLFQKIVRFLGVVCNPFICLPLLLKGYGSWIIATVTTIIGVVQLIVNIYYCIRGLHVKFILGRFDRKLVHEISGFSFFIFLNMIIDQVNWSVDKFILGRVSGTAAVAVYGVGSQINSLYLQFSTAISSVFSPRVNRIAAEESKEMNQQFTTLFIKVGRMQFIVLGLLATGFVFFGKYFITDIYTTSEYALAYPVALLLILPVSIPLIQNVGIEIQRSVNKHWFRSIAYMVMAILNVFVSIPLAREYGPVGSALGTAGSLLLANGLIMNIYYHKAIGINMIQFWKSIFSLAKGIIVPILFGIVILRYIVFDNWKQFIILVLLYTLVYCLSIWILGMNQEERTVVLKIKKRMLHKDR